MNRKKELHINSTAIKLPCFFPSVSSIRTNLAPVEYIELLDLAGYPHFLISAYDLSHCSDKQYQCIDTYLKQSKAQGTVILMDSGNYESYWKDDKEWHPANFHKVASDIYSHLCFCYDDQNPAPDSELIAQDVVSNVNRDQAYSDGTVIPIIHGSPTTLPNAVRIVAKLLNPILLAVPERELGEGIIERTRTVRNIRDALNTSGIYYPLHLLGTGNPLSITAYALAGADSFDGLEWCKTTVDHQTGKLLHFQQWDLICEQTEWGQSRSLPYIQSVLMHNLCFYEEFIENLRDAIHYSYGESFIQHFLNDEKSELLINAGKEGN